MIRIDYVREFVTLVNTGSFSKASEALFISQPSLSRHISILEAELGVRLLERTTRKVALTQAGQELYQDFAKLLHAEQSVFEHAGAIRSGTTGKLRITSPLYWDVAFAEPLILRFTEQYPGINVELEVCPPLDGIERLYAGQSDISVGFSYQLQPELDCVTVGEERLCFLMAREHPLAGKKQLSFQDIRDECFLLPVLDAGLPIEQADVYQLFLRHGIDPSQIVVTDKPTTIGRLLLKRKALCLSLSSMGNLRREYLISIPLTDDDCVQPVCLFCRRDNTDEAVRMFLEAGICPDGSSEKRQ